MTPFIVARELFSLFITWATVFLCVISLALVSYAAYNFSYKELNSGQNHVIHHSNGPYSLLSATFRSQNLDTGGSRHKRTFLHIKVNFSIIKDLLLQSLIQKSLKVLLYFIWEFFETFPRLRCSKRLQYKLLG